MTDLNEREAEMLQNSLKTLAETQKLLEETSVELHLQGSTLNRTENSLNHINHMTKESEKLSTQMTSFWGRFMSNFRSNKPYEAAEIKPRKVEDIEEENKYRDGDILDELNKNLVDLKNNSRQFNKEISYQNEQLERIAEGVVKSQASIKRSDDKIKKMLE